MPWYFNFQTAAVEAVECNGYKPRIWSQMILDQIPGFPLPRCIIFGKYLNISVLQFSHLSSEYDNSRVLRSVSGLSELKHTKYIGQSDT